MWRNKAAFVRRLWSCILGDSWLKLTKWDDTWSEKKSIFDSSNFVELFVQITMGKKVRKSLVRIDQSAHFVGLSAHSRDKRSAKAWPTIVLFEGSQNYVRIPWHLYIAASTIRRPCRGSLFPRFYYSPYIGA